MRGLPRLAFLDPPASPARPPQVPVAADPSVFSARPAYGYGYGSQSAAAGEVSRAEQDQAAARDAMDCEEAATVAEVPGAGPAGWQRKNTVLLKVCLLYEGVREERGVISLGTLRENMVKESRFRKRRAGRIRKELRNSAPTKKSVSRD
jgi:hypothetical protein